MIFLMFLKVVMGMLFATMGIVLLMGGLAFWADPALISAQATIYTGFAFFGSILPAMLVISGISMVAVAWYDGIHRFSDWIVAPFGLLMGLLGVLFAYNSNETSLLFDRLFGEDGTSVTALAVLIGICSLPPIYVAYKFLTEPSYPARPKNR